MARTYTLAECRAMLDVDYKTFQRWLDKAGIDTDNQISKVDNRIKFLTEAQLAQLAEDHGRTLKPAQAHTQEIIPVSAYKLLIGKVETLERQAGIQEHQSENHGRLWLDHDEKLATITERLDRQEERTSEAHRQIEALREQLATAQAQITAQATQITALTEQFAAQATQIAALKPKSARSKTTSGELPDLPAGTVIARVFAETHGISRDRMEGMIRRNEIASTPTPLGSRTQHQLTPEQQAQAIKHWDDLNIAYQRCPDCPHAPA